MNSPLVPTPTPRRHPSAETPRLVSRAASTLLSVLAANQDGLGFTELDMDRLEHLTAMRSPALERALRELQFEGHLSWLPSRTNVVHVRLHR